MPNKDYNIAINIKAVSNFGQITKKLDAQLNKMNRSVDKTSRSAKKSAAAFKSMESAMGRIAFIAVPAFTLAMRSIWKEGTKFETATKDLSALTGITGDRLAQLTGKAEVLSVQWGRSADNIVAGMKRIASNKSEFIEIEGAIEDVAEKASVLSRASGLTFFKSGEVITQTMNQFKLGLQDSERIINTFAAGAKLGSFEIDKLAQVFSRAGGAMKSINLDFEDAMSVSMIGSRLGLTGEMVGTQLKTGLLRLAQQDDIFNPMLSSFDEALQNLADARLTPKELMAVFGLESFQVMQAVTQNVDLFKKWKKEITGTDLAYIQASKNMEALVAKTDLLWQKFKKIQRAWFFNKKTQDNLNIALERMNNFLDQSTWQSVLMLKTFKMMGVVLAASFAIFIGGKLFKGVRVLWTAVKFISNKKTWAWILKASGGMKKGFLGTSAALARSLILLTAMFSLVTEIGKSFAMMSPLIQTMFENQDWEGLGWTIGQQILFGVWKGFLKLGQLLMKPFIALEKVIGMIFTGEKFSNIRSELEVSMQGLYDDVGVFQQSILDRKRQEVEIRAGEKASFLSNYLNSNPDIAKQEKDGEVLVKVAMVDGALKANVTKIGGAVKTEGTGDTSILPNQGGFGAKALFGY